MLPFYLPNKPTIKKKKTLHIFLCVENGHDFGVDVIFFLLQDYSITIIITISPFKNDCKVIKKVIDVLLIWAEPIM